MVYSFAPMEGITSHIYRRLHHEMFGGADKYYSPFIAPDSSGKFKGSCLRDILPQNNTGICLIPQVLCNNAEAFLAVSRQLQDMGYKEINLNAGCPSGTVVPKHKGAGMLSDLRSLDNFLADVFSRCAIAVSIKTRMGLESVEEFPAILEIYNKYPISELIIHARDRAGMYKSTPDIPAFAEALKSCRMPVCYNGNVFSSSSQEALLSAAPGLERIMLGRGACSDPALFRRLKGGSALKKEELRDFHDRLLNEFKASGLDDRFTVGRLKELWFYMLKMFPGSAKEAKKLLKARSLSEYSEAVQILFAAEYFDPRSHF